MGLPSLILKLLESIPEESVTIHRVVCKTGMNQRTVKKYLDLIMRIQNEAKIVKVQTGFRVLIKKEATI